jgi:hypothetical protein
MEEMNLSMIYLIYYKNFCKCHNVLPPNTKINKSRLMVLYRKGINKAISIRKKI